MEERELICTHAESTGVTDGFDVGSEGKQIQECLPGFGCATNWVDGDAIYSAMGQLIRHFGEKLHSVLDKLNLKCLFHTQVEKPQQIYITQIFISFYIYLYLELHGKVRGKDRSHESQQYNTANTEALKHTTPIILCSCQIPSHLSHPSSDILSQRSSPITPG